MLTKQDIDQIGEVVDKKLRPIKSDLKKLKQGQELIIKYANEEAVGLKKRSDRVETVLGLPVLETN